MEKSIVISDLHIPFEDKKVVDLVLRFIKEQEPDNIFIDGDLIDCLSISHFPVRPDTYIRLADEIKLGKEFLTRLREASLASKIIYIYGNHEARLVKYITTQAREFFELVSLKDLLKTDDLNIEVVDSGLDESYYQYGRLLIGHFDKVKKYGGETGKVLLDEKGMSLIQAHTHRVGAHVRRNIEGNFLGAWETGCLCNLDAIYKQSADWCHGFSVVYKEKKGSKFQVIQVPIINYSFFWGDEEYN